MIARGCGCVLGVLAAMGLLLAFLNLTFGFMPK